MPTKSSLNLLPIPAFFDPNKVGSADWDVQYEARFADALAWRDQHGLKLANQGSRKKVCLLIVDPQNTFCIPGMQLYVGGRTGTAAIDDNRRLTEFIYRHLGLIDTIAPSMDTHRAFQIFHRIFWINAEGKHPDPYSFIRSADLKNGKWFVNPAVAHVLGLSYTALQAHALHYTEELEGPAGKFALQIWPFHAMLGGRNHAIVPSIEEALFFHSIARASQTEFEMKGLGALSENYSILRPEVLTGPRGEAIGQKNTRFYAKLLKFDYLLIAGQAKSHCVAWTIQDLLNEIKVQDPKLAEKVYIMQDCTSSVYVPPIGGNPEVDFEPEAEAAFKRFAQEGMRIVRSTDPVDKWPDFQVG